MLTCDETMSDYANWYHWYANWGVVAQRQSVGLLIERSVVRFPVRRYLRNILGQDVYPYLSGPFTRCGLETVTGGLACISCVRAEVAAMAGEDPDFISGSQSSRWAAIINSRQGSREAHITHTFTAHTRSC